MISDNFCGGRALGNAAVITGMAIILLVSYAGVAAGSPATYTWKFDKFAIGKNATGSALESSQGVSMPDIIKLPDGRYRMYYGASLSPAVSGATTAIKSAMSSDGINWTVESGYRLLGDGDGDSGPDGIPANEGIINGARVVRMSSGTYRMYYQASTSGTNPPDFRVKSAISSDGMNWTREGTRVDINYPNGGANQFSLAGHSYVIRFADNDYVILISGNYNGKTAMQISDLVIGTSNDGLTFSNFSVLYTNGHDPFVVKLANGPGYRLFYGILLERQRTAFSSDGKNWQSINLTTETILLNSTGNEVTEASTEAPGDRAALELATGEIILFVNWGSPSVNIALMRQVGNDTVGLYRNSTGAFYLRNSNNGGAADLSFLFGPGGLKPIKGDYDGSGNDTAGVYNAGTGTFYLKNSNSAGAADATAQYGPGGSDFQPVVGDWNGDKTATIGLYQTSTGTFYLRNSNSGGAADTTAQYGPGGSDFLPLVGDWNGDGTDTIGLYRISTGTFYLKNSNSAGAADTVVQYGPGGSDFLPVVGDWNSDGTDTIGLYSISTGTFYLKNSNSGGAADTTAQYGPGGSDFLPVVGDWDGQ